MLSVQSIVLGFQGVEPQFEPVLVSDGMREEGEGAGRSETPLPNLILEVLDVFCDLYLIPFGFALVEVSLRLVSMYFVVNAR